MMTIRMVEIPSGGMMMTIRTIRNTERRREDDDKKYREEGGPGEETSLEQDSLPVSHNPSPWSSVCILKRNIKNKKNCPNTGQNNHSSEDDSFYC